MKSKTKSNILAALVFLSGLSVLLYPYISNEWNTWRQKQLIVNYHDVVEESGEEDRFQVEWEKAWKFNDELLPMILPDSFAEAELLEADPEYMSCLNINEDGIMGMVEIPKIQITLPIYHTTRSEFLDKGAGHLHGSSLPAGGENIHAVISAHRGLPSASLFTDLDKLHEGDHFLLYILNDILCYEVDQVKVVKPDETEDLNVVEGMDLVTLLTCTPYGVNSHRLLVRGHRVPYVIDEVKQEENTAEFSIYTNYLAWIAFGIGLTILFAIIMILRERARRRRIRAVRKMLKFRDAGQD